jgi:hypothetical protein
MPVPLVVLVEHEPFPLERGSWNCCPVAGSVYTLPADTVPVAGAPDSEDWQLVSAPPNAYVKSCAAVPNPGEKLAVPSSWQPPPD